MTPLAVTLLILTTEAGPSVVQTFDAPGMCKHIAAQLAKTDTRPMRCMYTYTKGANA